MILSFRSVVIIAANSKISENSYIQIHSLLNRFRIVTEDNGVSFGGHYDLITLEYGSHCHLFQMDTADRKSWPGQPSLVCSIT